MYPAQPRAGSASQLFGYCGLVPAQVLSEVDYRADCDEVFLAGSIVEGFGNSLSDVDVLVVTDRRKPHAMRLVPNTARWLDIVYIERAEVVQHINSLPCVPPGYSEWDKARPAPFSALEVLHDLSYGLSVSKPWAETATPSLSKETIRASISRSWALSNIVSARARWHDACGALKDGHNQQAKYLRSLCMNFCIDAYTGLFGETDINVKWRWSKLTRIASNGLDPLKLLEACSERGIDTVSWAEAATVLSNVISLFVTGKTFEVPTPGKDGERFEIAGNRWALVSLDGFSREVPPPPISAPG